MKVLMMLAITLLVSCGKKNDSGDKCRSRATMVNRCVRNMSPAYGYAYSVHNCSNQYFNEGCY